MDATSGGCVYYRRLALGASASRYNSERIQPPSTAIELPVM